MLLMPLKKSLYAGVCTLPVKIEEVTLELLEQRTSSGWLRRTTLVTLHGSGVVGRGEDVNYSSAEQLNFAQSTKAQIQGHYESFGAFSRALDSTGLFFDKAPEQATSILYRRWAFESAALDLALRQADTSLAEIWQLNTKALRFVVSTGLGATPSTDPLDQKLAANPNLEFKVDYSEGFTDSFIEELSRYKIACVDFKGHYHGSFSGAPVDTDRYCAVAKAFPSVVLEDPGFSGLEALAPQRDRLSWDYPIRSVADLNLMPPTAWINMKPSRFGFLSEYLRAVEFCYGREIKLYGGGQFELGIGRSQAQELASLFYPDGPNDLAPSDYNNAEIPGDVEQSPMTLPEGAGFGYQAVDLRIED